MNNILDDGVSEIEEYEAALHLTSAIMAVALNTPGPPEDAPRCGPTAALRLPYDCSTTALRMGDARDELGRKPKHARAVCTREKRPQPSSCVHCVQGHDHEGDNTPPRR